MTWRRIFPASLASFFLTAGMNFSIDAAELNAQPTLEQKKLHVGNHAVGTHEVQAANAYDIELAQRQAAVADARATLVIVPEWCAAGRANEAADRVSAARARLLLLSGTDIEELVKQCNDAYSHCMTAESQANIRQGRSSRQDDLTAAYDHHSNNATLHRSIFLERLARIKGLVDRFHFELALASARRLVSDYGEEPEAERLFNEVLAKAHEQRRLSVMERNKEATQEVHERIERELIPHFWDGQPAYPVDWHDRSANRAQRHVQEAQVPEWEELIRARLAERISVDCQQMLPSEVFQEFGRRTQLNTFIDPAILALDKPMPGIKAQNITAEAALSWMCRLVNVPWTIARGAVCIGTDLDPAPVNGYYDLSEMMFGGIDQSGRPMGFQSINNSGGNGGAGAGSLFAQSSSAAPSGLTTEAVVDLIKKSISPATWTRPGCSIEVRGTTLLIVAPARVHSLVRQFIHARSLLQAKLVLIDMKWMEISDGYLEEIGVTWNGNSNQSRHTVAATTTNPMARNNLDPSISSSAATTGLDLTSTLLKDIQLEAVLHAVEGTGRGTILSSPSLVTMNNVRSNCSFTTQTAYISGYDINGSNVVTFSGTGFDSVGASYDPKISVISTGAALDVKPIVSADDKYVQLDLIPQWTDLTLYSETFFVRRGILLVPYSLELPQVHLRSASTTAQVPHGGSLLIGGFGYVSDQTTSTVVPFLGHIPFLGRLFGARGRYSDRRQLYLLATVTIHNYQELEANK